MRISDWSSDVCSSDLEINEAMKLACVRAIARLAQMDSSDLGSAYGGEVTSFGVDYIIPRPFDPRLLTVLAPGVAEAATVSGVAVRAMVALGAHAVGIAGGGGRARLNGGQEVVEGF